MQCALAQHHMTPWHNESGSPNEGGSLLNASIMIVDDEPTTMEVVQAFLEESGYRNFALIEDSRTALAALERQPPDLLLLDLIMPEVSGFDLLKSIRQNPKLQRLPVIILTSSSDNQDKLAALDLGATDFLAKPVDPSELRLRVRNTLGAKAYTDHLVYYDPLTQLPNRHLFMDCLEKGLASARANGEKVALLTLELDQFDTISDTLGLVAGDEILRQLTERFKEVVRGIDLLGQSDINAYAPVNLFHLDSGVFAILLQRINHEQEAAMIADCLLESIRWMLKVDQSELYMTASIGIATYPTEQCDAHGLFQLASIAKDYVKNRGGDAFQFSSKRIHSAYQKRLSIEGRLRRALERNEFTLFYQPQVDIHANTITGVEALLRWQVNASTMIPPNKFIPIAEETQLIIPIGEWVLGQACRQLATWLRAGKAPIRMSVNLSAVQFEKPEMPDTFKQIIEASGVPPHLLTLEVTESMFLDKVEQKIEAMHQLKKLGVRMAIDDFGTGYSCLSYLKRLPLDEMKIDRSFFTDLFDDTKGRALVATLIYLSRSFNMLTIAEGVETDAQLRYLKEGACDQYQGYLFSPPVPAEKLVRMLSRAR